MSAAVTPARRLLAMLEEERSLETRPLDEVLADLDAHGVDVGGSIKLARRLAERNAGPAAALLEAVIEDEAAEAEIAALEAAPIDEVRDRLDVGTVAAVAAEAKRRGGAGSNVVGLRRRKGVAWAWAGSLVGMAACVLIVVAAWWPPSELRAPAPEFATVEVRPAPPADTVAAPPAAADAARPEPETGVSAPEGQAPGRIASSAGMAESEVDGADGIAEAMPAPSVMEERSQVPGMAPRLADRAELPASSDTADAPATAVLSDREAPLPPLPPTMPEERRALADDALPGPSGGRGATGQPAPLPDRVGQPAIPQARSDGAVRGLHVEPRPREPDPGNAGGTALVVDGIVYPRILGVGAGPEWSDGAFPILYPDREAGDRAAAIGLLPDPPGAEDGAGQTAAVTVTGSAAGTGDVSGQDGAPGLAAGLTRGLGVMLRDARAAGAGPWTGQAADRLADARAVADGGTIIALLTIRAAGMEADAVLLPRENGAAAAADPLLPLLSHWFGDEAARFRLIVLPPP